MVYRGANVAGTRALLGPVSVVTNPVHSVRSYLGVHSGAFHLLQEHSNDGVATVFLYHQRTALIPVARELNVVVHIIPWPIIHVCNMGLHYAQMSPSTYKKLGVREY